VLSNPTPTSVSTSIPDENPKMENVCDENESCEVIYDVQLDRKRKVEEGLLYMPTPMTFDIFFESLPLWILNLEPSYVKAINFAQFDSESTLFSHLLSLDGGAFYVDTVQKVNSTLMYKQTLNPTSLILISGSLTFFSAVLKHLDKDFKFLFIHDAHVRFRHLPHMASHTFHRLRHVSFGGATKFETLWACSSNLSFLPHTTKLRRSIYSFIDFSIRPKSFSIRCHDGSSVLSHLGLLQPQFLSQMIQMPSDFSSSGFGVRQLTISELGAIFGLPHRLHSCLTMDALPFVPVQMLDGLLRPLLRSLNPSGQVTTRSSKRLKVPAPVSDSAPILLPRLNRILPRTWIQPRLVAQKAAKDDDAEVDYSLWDNRVLSLWNNSRALIDYLRPLLLRRQFRRIFVEFASFLRKKHGIVYETYMEIRRQSCLLSMCRLRGGVKTDFEFLQNVRHSKKVTFNNFAEELRASLHHDISYGVQGLQSYMKGSYFNWDGGSTLLFWRWNMEFQTQAKVGFKPCISGKLPRSMKIAKKPKAIVFEKILSKVFKAIDRNYMNITSLKHTKNLIDYFGVEKGISDIRVVFNGTSCGLNDSVWAPNFWLPTAKSMVRVLGYNYKPVDIDLGEMFLNFPLSPLLIPYSGVDLTPFKARIKEKFKDLFCPDEKRLIATWKRDWMGFKPSPEWACRYYYIAEEFIRGNEKDPSNPLYWGKVILNLMGNPNYNPSLPNVFKWNDIVNRIAGDIKAYVDDLRALGWSIEHAWAIARIVAARLQYLGIQDAPRKRRVDGGPWAGTVFISSEDKVCTTVTKSKWEKGKDYILYLNDLLKNNPDADLDFKTLERIRGYLCHLGMTYDIIFPYLKGFHLLLCAHLPRRNEEGWKIRELEWLGYLTERKSTGKISEEEYENSMKEKFGDISNPTTVKAIPRFITCLKALTKFFSIDEPPITTQRSTNLQLLVYGFADASKTGFGASMDYGSHAKYRIGIWGADTDEDSSNFREFANLVETIESEVTSGKLDGANLIMATDNSTVESAIFRGNSSSEKLFDLVVRFRHAELKAGAKFTVTHVSGNRMKLQGTDGISRGQLKEGISIGQYMLQFCPWGETALERSPSLKNWLIKHFGDKLEFLDENGWFTRGHDHVGGEYDHKGYWRTKTRPGVMVWCPAPAAADAAFEELRKARLKRRKSLHIILVPRLMTTLWYKQLNKASDFIINIPNKFSFWPTQMCEPLTISFCLPFARFYPWQAKNTPKLFAIKRQLQSLLSETDLDPGNILQQLFGIGKKLPALPELVVRKLLCFEKGRHVSHIPNPRPTKRARSKSRGRRRESVRKSLVENS